MTPDEINEQIEALDKAGVHAVFWFVVDLIIERYTTPKQKEAVEDMRRRVST